MANIVTVDTLRTKGFAVSSLKDASQITLAENDIRDAYFPIDADFTDEKVVALLHALVYSLLLRRKIVATRYGSVQKVSQYTIAADNDSITQEIRSYCLARLEKYYDSFPVPACPDVSFKFKFSDILKLYDNILLV